MFITREEAIDILQNLSQSDILDEKITNAVDEIAQCIKHEKDGYHSWGADDTFIELYIAHRQDLLTDELISKMQEIDKKHRFTPAPYEEQEFDERT